MGTTCKSPAPTIDYRHDVRDTTPAGIGTGEQCPTKRVLRQPARGLELRRLHDPVQSVLARFGVPPPMTEDIRARAQLDDGDISAWFDPSQGQRQGCVSSPPLFNIFGMALGDVIFHGFAVDSIITSGLIHLDDAPRVDDRDATGDGAARGVGNTTRE